MKRKLFIGLLLFAVGIAGWWLWKCQAEQSASYQGRPIRDWALELHVTYEPLGTNAAATAFRSLGGKAIPVLRSLINQREPFYEKTLIRRSGWLPSKSRAYLFEKLKPGRTLEYRLGAIRAVGLLETNAASVLPEMLLALNDIDARVRWATAQVIGKLGPDAVDALISLTVHTNVNLRHVAVYALGEARTNAWPATTPLIRATMDSNESVRASAFYSLGRIGRMALPEATAQAVTNSDVAFRNAAFRSLVVLSPGGYFTSHLALSTNAPEVRRLAVLSLIRSRFTNDHVLNLFTNALSDEAPEVRAAAELALYRVISGKGRPPSP